MKKEYVKPEKLPTTVDLLKGRTNPPYYEVIFLDCGKLEKPRVNDCHNWLSKPPRLEYQWQRRIIEFALWLDCYLVSEMQHQRFFIQNIDKFLAKAEEHGIIVEIHDSLESTKLYTPTVEIKTPQKILQTIQ